MSEKKEIKKKTSAKVAKKGFPLGVVVVALVLVGVAAFFGLKGFQGGQANPLEFQKGMGYVTWSANAYQTESSDESLGKLRGLGANWVSVLTTWYQTNPWTLDISRTDKTPTDDSIRHAIRKAHELGMKVQLKLHLDLIDKADGSWRGEIGFAKESDWDKWFDKYTDYVQYYVKIANEEKVEMICIGTELSTSVTVKGYMWREMIGKIRSKYKGLLVYAAHWDRYMDIRFWDLLDYVGINAYFPLTEKMVPTYGELMEGWKKWVGEIEEFQTKTGKPVIFPECGCNSADGAAIRPWEHVARREVNLELQKDYYQALVDSFADKEWFYGTYWWYWGTNTHMGGKYNRGFSPQNKPAQDVLEAWYSEPIKR